ncbi:MAG: Rha family transcriptional regulator [Shewanella sp.]
MFAVMTQQEVTMSSREIAELTGKEHKNVLADIRKMLSDLNLDGRDFQSTYIDNKNRQQKEYYLPASKAICLISGYSVQSSKAICLISGYSVQSSKAICLISGYSVQSRMAIMSRIKDMDQVLTAIRDFEVPDDLPDIYVYAIRESETGRIKIGISRNPERRLKQLQIGNSHKLELVAYKKAENRYKDETAAHLDNKEHHIHGEWFNSSASIEKEIAQ